MTQPFKACFVPVCRNNSQTCPNKIFITVPRRYNRRLAWFIAAKRRIVCTPAYCCEDHFNLPEDSKNWLEHREVQTRLMLKENVVPHLNLESQPFIGKSSQLSDSAGKRRLLLLNSARIATPKKCGNKVIFEDVQEILPETHLISESVMLQEDADSGVVTVKNEICFDDPHFETEEEKINSLPIQETSISNKSTQTPQETRLKRRSVNSKEELISKRAKLSKVGAFITAVNAMQTVARNQSAPELITDEFENFGKSVAAHLRQLPLDVALECETDILHHLIQKRLNVTGK